VSYVNFSPSPLSAAKTKARTATVMANNEHSHGVCVRDAKQDRVWKTVNETAPNVFRNDTKLGRTGAKSVNRLIDLDPEFVSESWLLAIEVRDRVV
jgi:hypothetical protein